MQKNEKTEGFLVVPELSFFKDYELIIFLNELMNDLAKEIPLEEGEQMEKINLIKNYFVVLVASFNLAQIACMGTFYGLENLEDFEAVKFYVETLLKDISTLNVVLAHDIFRLMEDGKIKKTSQEVLESTKLIWDFNEVVARTKKPGFVENLESPNLSLEDQKLNMHFKTILKFNKIAKEPIKNWKMYLNQSNEPFAMTIETIYDSFPQVYTEMLSFSDAKASVSQFMESFYARNHKKLPF